ncbi:pyridoxal phosphate-dependent aminotransferase [Prosthecobacter dejongeii]|uniref:Aminotransferase n=1 Tax=Prosthecobacter dejongeii TaxID=48465 RepID=A0A7W8DQZ0_9BACT|nr:aminotransferase class I/II-fold pyridoxal phosphate-dependent enzyme [Prosthecobacter dejongeii]MBB5038882.1 aminotransferase [Prosthecobacter dejongeii]
MPQPARRLEVFTESVIREMTRLSNRHGSINLAQGFPDFDPSAELIEALAVAIRGPHHQYAVTWGAPRFRQALARKHSQYTGLDLDADRHLVVTCGSTEAMMVAMMTACDPGDKVIVFSPFYENYAADAILSGAIPVHITLHAPNFEFDRTELRQAFADGAKAIVICNPSNPCGKVFTREELLFIAGLAEEFDAFVLMDEVYEHIVYAPHQHTYFATLPGMWERTLSCGSLSKTYSITGWRLGHVIAPENLISRAKKVHDFLTVGAAAPLQEAAVTALDFPASYYEELQRDYDAKRDVFLGYMRQTGLSFSEPQGAYYTLLDISPLGFATDTEAAAWMTQEVGVTGVPGSSFYREPEHRFIRFHFAKKEETLRAAGEKLVEGLRRGR